MIIKNCLAMGIFLFLSQCALAGNPIGIGADPAVLLVDGTVYVYPTYRPDKSFDVYTSTDLDGWSQPQTVLDLNSIAWIKNKAAWAPSIIEKDGTYYFYYSLGPKPSYIGVAYGKSPLGPFTDSGRPLLSDNGIKGFEAIDPAVFKDPNSSKYFLYAGGSADNSLRVFELDPNMLGFAREIKVDTPAKFAEGVFMHYRDGIYYLSYSHGLWHKDSYSVHYATSKTPVGPWTYQGAILVSNDVYKGPGHHSFLYNPTNDEWFIFYHRWENVTGKGPYSGSRVLAIERIEYEPDGRIKPIVMTANGVGKIKLK